MINLSGYVKEEFERAIFSFNTLIALILCSILIFIGFSSTHVASFTNNVNAVSFFLLQFNGVVAVLPLFAPLIVSIPYSSSYAIDKRSGFLKNIYYRLDIRKYIIIRVVVNAVTGSGVLVFSLILTLIISMIIFRQYPINPLPSSFMRSGGAFYQIYNSNPLLFSLILIANTFIFGIVFSTLGLTISLFIENEYLPIIFPFLFAIIEGALAVPLGLEHILSYIYMVYPMFYSNSTIIGLVIQHITLLGLSLLIIYIRIFRRKGDKDV